VKKYTASYSSIKDNFVIININESHKHNSPYYGMFCVVQNILQRGKPTIPSNYVQKKLGSVNAISSRMLFLASDEIPSWNVIKGDDSDVYYPAEHFYYDLLPKYLGEDKIVRNLIIPEVDFKDILKKSTVLDGQQVDFYLPQLRTVIEIDGYSHKKFSQGIKDGIRDDALRKADITVLRISTEDIRFESANFILQMNKLKKAVKEANISSNLLMYDQYESAETEIKYDTIIRFEILLLELLKTGRISVLDKNWKFNIINTDVKESEFLFMLAFEDISLWISAISQMLKLEKSETKLVIDDSDSAIKIDISLFKRYTDVEKDRYDCIFIRNDYFPENDYYQIAYADTLRYSFTPETEEDDNRSLKFILNNLFPDLDDFRDGQPQIIKNVLTRNDTIGILPTGTGKSLCYQLSAMLQPGVSIIIVPIISLMIDQWESMNRRQINHVNAISSATPGEEKDRIINGFREGRYQFLWISPERFQNAAFRNTLAEINRKMNFAFAVIDEVHCLSEWGHDFRVSYLALVRILREYCPEATLLGLTATASQAVLEDLKAEFEVDGEAVKALTNMDRPELIFHRTNVKTESEKHAEIYSIIKENHRTYINEDGNEHDAIGIVFCPTVGGKVTGCNDVARSISLQSELDEQLTLRLAAYHGKLTNDERAEIQSQFMRNEYDVLMCTKAFDMGIDQPNIKYTIHDSMPQSIESFYQEAGRAGRDKDKSVDSHCYILFCPEEESEELEKITKEVFDPNTDIDRRKDLSRELHGDLSTIMWFWNNNKDTREEEYSRISEVLRVLYRGITRLPFDNRDKKKVKNLQPIQEALYKLSLLGVVDNWTIDYMSLDEGIVNVEYAGVDEKDIRHRLLAYINKYDPEFQFDEPKSNYQRYYDIAHDAGIKPITQLIHILIEWTNENIMNSRLQSTYNMLQWLDPKISDEEFRTRINEFFKFSEESVIYNGIIYHPLDYNNWFDLIFVRDESTKHRLDMVITIESAERRLAGLQRYLESYRYNTGLNYLSGVLRLYTSSYKGSEGEWRLDEAFQSIKESLDKDKQNEIIKETLKFAIHLELLEKDAIAQVIIKYFPEFAKEIFISLKDRYSLSILLEEPAKRISHIMEEI